MNIILFEKGVRHFDAADERAEHLIRVLHASSGYEFTAGEINGDRGRAVVTSIADGIDFEFTPEKEDSALYPLTVILAQVRPICMKRILRELVSMGVGHLVLTSSELGEKSYRDATMYKNGEYLDIMRSGAMQGGHTGLTRVTFAISAKEAVCYADGVRLLPDNVIGSRSFSSYELEGRPVTLAIGPERGWSDNERRIFQEAGFSPVLMGSHILRTETAAVAGTALALAAMGSI